MSKKEFLPVPLKTFLTQKGLLKKFLRNSKKHYYSTDVSVVEIWKKYKDSPEIIEMSFLWYETPEGYKFWEQFSREYKQYYETN